MTIVKRLLLPLLLLGFALLPSSISAAREASDLHTSDLHTSDLQVAVPTPRDTPGYQALAHPYHAHDGDHAEQDLDDNADSQESGQNNHANSCGLISIGDVAPISAQITILPINNLQVLGGVSDVEEQSTMRDNDQQAGNDETNQSNQSEQNQEAEQEAGQVNVETSQPSSQTDSSRTADSLLPTT